MTHTSPEHISVAATSAAHEITTQDVRDVAYDPSRVRDLGVGKIDTIEDAIIAAEEIGATPDQLRALVAQELQKAGIDPEDSIDDTLVARIIGTDGKAELRAIVTRPEDFGARIRDVRLVERPSAIERSDDESANDERLIEAIAEDIKKDILHIENELGDRDKATADDARGLSAELVRLMQRLVDPYETVDQAQLRRLGERVEDARRKLAANTVASEQVATAVVRFGGSIEGYIHESTRLGEANAVRAVATLEKAAGLQEELQAAAVALRQQDTEASQVCNRILGQLEELLSSRYGHESLGHAIRQQALLLDESLGRSNAQARHITELAEQVRQPLY